MIEKNLRSKIIECLNEIKGGGTFCSDGSKKFVFPHLSIDGVGELAYPINELQARALIHIAHKAPYGKGHETLVDTTVRSAWEIDGSLLKFEGKDWSDMMEKILNNVQKDLGIEDYEVDAQVYKLLIYEKGDFFLTHKDSEKEKGMFGSLIISFPSRHEGAELIVRFEGEEKIINFAPENSVGKIAYGAFYADCDHEVKPLIEGYRVVLVYNLIQKSSGKKVELQSFKKHTDCLASCLINIESLRHDQNIPLIILLNHQYTPTNFNLQHLKLNDRAKVKALLQAAKDTGLYASLCLVTATKEGSPIEYDEDCDEIGEVYDESISIEKWADGGFPEIGNLILNDEDIVAPFIINDEEPFERENSGFMGNYGPDIIYWYHYGAVALWTEDQHKKILFDTNDGIRIKWLKYYNTNRNNLDRRSIDMARYLVQILSDEESSQVKYDFAPVIDWLILEDDKEQLQDLGYKLLDRYFYKIKAEKWLELGQHYGVNSIHSLLNNQIKTWNQKRIKRLISILHEFSEKRQFDEFVQLQMALLPKYYYSIVVELMPNDFPIDAATFQKLVELENTWTQAKEWVVAMFDVLSRCEKYEYLVEVWVKSIQEIKTQTPLLKKILDEAIHRLKMRVDDKPEPPKDWSRPIPQSTQYKKCWEILKEFMLSPTTEVFEYRRVQKERDEMEYAINHSKVDLTTMTIKKGSPHLLRITKTQDAYQEKMRIWNRDSSMLKSLSGM